MASTEFTDAELEQRFGRRSANISLLFDAWEFGYRCPQLHTGKGVQFSTFNDHIWCTECGVDWPSEKCPIRRPSWMNEKIFEEFLDALPFNPILLSGIDDLGGEHE